MIRTKHVAICAVIAVAAAGSAILGVRTKQTSAVAPQSAVAVSASRYAPGVLPDPVKTPGAVNPDVTDATISNTIAVRGWTATIRPPASYTTALKKKQLASGYAVNGDMKLSDYEEDHLISLEDGGNPTDERNLWPALWHLNSGGYDLGMKTKDVVENAASAAVKSHRITLQQAQDGLAHDWPSLYLKLVGPWPKYAGGAS